MFRRVERFTIGEHHLHAADLLAGGAITEPVASRGIESHDAADSCDAAGRRIGGEHLAERGEIAIELPQHKAGLHDDLVVLDADNPPHPLRKIKHETRAEGLPGETRPSAAGVYRQHVIGGVADRRLHVADVARPHHPQRRHFVDAAVRAVHLHEGVITTNLPGEQSPQVGLNAFALRIHGV
jgi:hypothetical protein